jgi:hypothetical protein
MTDLQEQRSDDVVSELQTIWHLLNAQQLTEKQLAFVLWQIREYSNSSIIAALHYCARTLKRRMFLADLLESIPENAKALSVDPTGRFRLMSDGSKRRIITE